MNTSTNNIKWEYKIERDLSESELEEYGAKGWELVTITKEEREEDFIADDICYYFKRKIN